MTTLRTRLEPIAKDIAVILRDDLGPKQRSAALAGFAREVLQDAQETNQRALGRVPSHETWVDGRKGAALESVRADNGQIIFEFDLTEDVFEWILAMLTLNSPIGPGKDGHYGERHKFFADGRLADPSNPPSDASRWVFVNTAPYSRKIERPGFSKQSPAGVYQVVAKMASDRFGKSVRVRYTFETIGAERNPAIVITPR